MPNQNLEEIKSAILSLAGSSKVFLRGAAGVGKTTLGLAWLKACLLLKIPAEKILILIPQRTLATPYYQTIHQAHFSAGTLPAILTLSGLAQRMISLFWSLISKEAGFKFPADPPTFLTLETAQYEMSKIVLPMIEGGEFESVTIDRNRLYSQILDNLNKAALIDFPYTDFGNRLSVSHSNEASQTQMYLSAQKAATNFRIYCLEKNLLDYSLQIEIFTKYLWPSMVVKDYLLKQYQHLIYDNIEEDPPIVHDIVADWLPSIQSAFLLYDELAGYRSFLGADTPSALKLREHCNHEFELKESFVMPAVLNSFQKCLSEIIQGQKPTSIDAKFQAYVTLQYSQFIPEMISNVASVVEPLINEKKMPANQIAILAPFLSDALRFSLQNLLAEKGFSSQSHRPSRAIVDEPAARTFLTLSKIAHPQWNLIPSEFEVRYSLMQSLTEGDLIRADLLSKILYRQNHPEQRIGSFDQIIPQMQERITYHLGERYEKLRKWLLNYMEGEPIPLEPFISKLYGEVLSQQGFGFHNDLESARIVTRLLESIHKFTKVTSSRSEFYEIDIGMEYIQTIERGLLSALSLPYQGVNNRNSILIMPAYSFLMLNHPVKIQFWLDIGSPGWSERINQPLTHPYILSRHWDEGRMWTDADEVESSQIALARIVQGLVHRCSERIFLFSTKVNEQGMEESGKLIKALQVLYKNIAAEGVSRV